LDHVIVFNEAHLPRSLTEYFAYYHEAQSRSALDRNAPIPRQIEPPSQARVIAIPHAGGLHHRYTRAARGSGTRYTSDPPNAKTPGRHCRNHGFRAFATGLQVACSSPADAPAPPLTAPTKPDGNFGVHTWNSGSDCRFPLVVRHTVFVK
jgi:hypothetical protein